MKRFIYIFVALLSVAVFSLSFVTPRHASADSFNQNNIIDDAVFDNANSMSAGQIDSWLNTNFPSSCISTNNGFSSPDPIGYNPSQGFLYGGNVSAGQVIYDASQAYGINPQVLISTLQKESSVVSGDASYHCAYMNTAMGYGCPDSGSCPTDPATMSGFSKQVIHAAWLFKFGEQRSEGNTGWAVIKGGWDNSDDPPTCYGGPMTQGTLSRGCGQAATYYDGYTTIDGTAVHMDDGATAALYWYTPHFSGNQHFFSIFTGWFGSTTNSSLKYSVIQDPSANALYLQTSAGKYYLPSYAIMHDWGLDTLPVQQVSEAYFNSLPTHGWVGHLLSDDWGNLFIVENQTLHYVRQSDYLSLLNLSAGDAVQSLGLTRSMPSTTWLGRFAQDSSQPNGQIWLLDKGQKHAIADANMLYEWGYTPDQLTTLSTSYLSGLTTGSPVTQYASAGSANYVVDTGRKLSFGNGDIQNAYYGSTSPVSYDASTLSFLPTNAATVFGVNSANGQWFMLEAGKKHYISSGDLAQQWGKTGSTPLSGLSPAFLAALPDGGNLAYVVQTASPSQEWIVDGTKHYVSSSSVAQAWLASGVSPPTYSSQSLDLLSQGADATTTINVPGSPYTYTMDAGTKHYLMSSAAKSAWGGTVMSVSSALMNNVPEGSFLNYLAKDSSGQAYLVMNGTEYPISSSYYDAWGVNSSTPVMASATLSRYTLSNTTLQAFIKIGSTSYIMSGGNKVPLTKFIDAYQPASHNPATLPSDYFPTASDATYLVQSTDTGNSTVWLMVNGKKIQLSFEQAVSFGYISRGVQPTELSPTTLSTISDDSQQGSLLIQKSGSGIKFLNFGYALGFPDGATLTNTVGASNPILVVDDATFDAIPLAGNTSRIVKDDAGNLYYMDSGQRRWVTSWAAMKPYTNIPITYLYGTTMALIPQGSPIN